MSYLMPIIILLAHDFVRQSEYAHLPYSITKANMTCTYIYLVLWMGWQHKRFFALDTFQVRDSLCFIMGLQSAIYRQRRFCPYVLNYGSYVI